MAKDKKITVDTIYNRNEANKIVSLDITLKGWDVNTVGQKKVHVEMDPSLYDIQYFDDFSTSTVTVTEPAFTWNIPEEQQKETITSEDNRLWMKGFTDHADYKTALDNIEKNLEEL